LEAAKAAIKQYHNQNHLDTTFRVGQWVMLYIKNIDTGRLSKKLDYWQMGPF
jgi:hypothetical protein